MNFIKLAGVGITLAVVGCGGGGSSNTAGVNASTVYGTAATGLAINGKATLRDANGLTRTTSISQPDGKFHIDVTGLNAPYFLKATDNSSGNELYSIASADGNFNINPLTNLAVIAAAKDIDPLTQLPDAPFNDPTKFASLTSDQLTIAVDRVMSRLSPEFQAALATNGADKVSPLTDIIQIGSGLDGVLDKFTISLDTATGEISERSIENNTDTLLGSVDMLGASTPATCEQTAIAVAPPPAGTLLIMAIPACKTYDATSYSGGNGVVYVGLLNGDTPDVLAGTLTYSGTSQGAKNVGTYSIVPGGQTSSNYIISYVENTLTISPYKLPLTVINSPKVYDSGSAGSSTGVLIPGDPITLVNAIPN